MSIVFILLGALAATLFIISRLGLDVPAQEMAEVTLLKEDSYSREELSIAA